jgi:hypothetical protein
LTEIKTHFQDAIPNSERLVKGKELGLYISQLLKIYVRFLYIVAQVMTRYWILVSGYWIG